MKKGIFAVVMLVLTVTPAFAGGPVDWVAEKFGYVSNSLFTAEQAVSRERETTISLQHELLNKQLVLIQTMNEEKSFIVVLFATALLIIFIRVVAWNGFVDFFRRVFRKKSTKTEEDVLVEEVSPPTKKK